MTSVTTGSSMSVDEAFEIAGGFVEVDDATFSKAMDVVKKYNEEVIAKTQKAFEDKDEKALLDALDELETYDASLAKTLRDTYRKKEDDEAFLSTVSSHSNEMVDGFNEMRDADKAIADARNEEESINVSSDVLAQNTEYLYKLLDNGEFSEQLEKDLFEDEEVKEAVENTVIVDGKADEEKKEVSATDRDAHFKMLLEKAKLDVFIEQSKSKDFSEKSDDEKKASLFEEVKTSFLGTITELRTANQVMEKAKDAEKAVEEENETFFQKELETLGRMDDYQRKGIDYAKSSYGYADKQNVHSDLVIAACADSEAKVKKFEKQLDDFASATDGEQKSHFEKAWKFANSFRTSFADKAKKVWGQRYEFANSVKDNAPKIITNLAFTSSLVAGTVAGAPWLGTAVLAYGAYKTTSAWVWPIVTKARKQARADKKAHPKIKIKFVDQLRESASTIFSNKEERKKYIKEASWGTIGGLVGLGAAGVVGAAAGAVAAKSAQSLSSMAVHSVNNAIETFRTMKDKEKNFWDKGTKFLGLALGGAGLYYLSQHVDLEGLKHNISEKVDDLFSQKDDVLDMPKGGASTNLAGTVETSGNVQEEATKVLNNEDVGDKVNVGNHGETTVSKENGVEHLKFNGSPDVWTDETGITEKQWSKLQTFWDEDPDKAKEVYQTFYGKISNDMLGEGGMFEGMTREQVLFKYQRLSAWNLTGHQETIEKLDKFFKCGEAIELNDSDTQVINSVTQAGGIKDVAGSSNTVVDHMSADCKDGISVNTNETVQQVNETVKKVNVAQETDDVEFIDTGITQTIDLTQQETITATLYKGNGITGAGNFVKEVNQEDIAVDAQNVKVNTNANGGTLTLGTSGIEQDFVPESEEDLFTDTGKVEEIRVDNITITGVTGGVETDFNPNGVVTAGVEGVETDFNPNGVVTAGVEGVETDFNPEATSGVVTVEKDGYNVSYRTDYTVVEGSDDVEIGTKAAGNIEERGGYKFTGLTEEQYNATHHYFQDKFGNEAYDRFASLITDDMRARGGIFEGLSVEQSMFAIKQVTSWGYGETGQFNHEVDTLFDYLKGCDDNIASDEAAKIKALVDRVNEDGTMENVNGSKAIMTRHFVTGDCGEASSLVTEKAASGNTEGSGEELIRLFMKPEVTVVSEEPIFEYLGQEPDRDLTVTEEIHISEVKANNYDGVKVVDDNVKPSEVTEGIKAENKSIVTDNGTVRDAEANDKNLGKGKIRTPRRGRESDFVADAGSSRSATINGRPLSSNPDLARWQQKLNEGK